MRAYRAPTELPEPGFHPFDTYDERSERWLDELRAWVKDRARRMGKRPHRLAGKVIRLPWADGYAQYMVASGTELIHLPLGDAWDVPAHQIRGLRVADLDDLVRRDERLAELFAERRAERGES